jgi:hypothetical protein
MIAGCAGGRLPASVSKGTCKIIPQAEYEILGQTRHDQRWIDETIEGEIGGCGFKRPKPRPTSWDVVIRSPIVVQQVPKKRSLIKRIFVRNPKAPPEVVAPVVAPRPAEPPTSPPWTATLPTQPVEATKPTPVVKRAPVDALLESKPHALEPAKDPRKRCRLPFFC